MFVLNVPVLALPLTPQYPPCAYILIEIRTISILLLSYWS